MDGSEVYSLGVTNLNIVTFTMFWYYVYDDSLAVFFFELPVEVGQY